MTVMGMGRKLSIFIGMAQGVIGAFATVFAYVLYHNFFNVQELLNVPAQDVVLYMLVFIVFGSLSIISGPFLVNGQ